MLLNFIPLQQSCWLGKVLRPVRLAYHHQPAVLFSQNKPATSQQYFSLRTNQHQPSVTSQT
jgi:hypothetical protein